MQKGFSNILIPIAIVLILGIGAMGYFVLDNKSLQSQSSPPNPKVTSLPAESNQSGKEYKEEIQIIDGSVYKLLPSGEKKLLLNKEDFRKNTERYIGQPENYNREDPFFTFSQVNLSPDKTKMLLFALGGISIERLYYVSVEGDDVIQIDVAREAVWSNNSRYIAYANKPADAGPIIRVYVYDTEKNKGIEISRNHKIKSLNYDYLGFSNLKWLDDDSGIKVKYDAYKGDLPYGEKTSEGETIINFDPNSL